MENVINQIRRCREASKGNEVWREVNFDDFLTSDLKCPSVDDCTKEDFACSRQDLNLEATLVIENGYHFGPMCQLDCGIMVGSLRQVREMNPDLVEPFFGKCATHEVCRRFETLADRKKGRGFRNPYFELNEQLYTDGLFVMVPDNVQLSKPVQILNAIHGPIPALLHTRNLILVGNNAKASFIFCDDSFDGTNSFSNNVTELMIKQGAKAELYKMQNLNDKSALLNQTFVTMEEGSTFRSAAITLNGGHIRNHTEVRMNGRHCDCQANGLYLIDKQQQADNYIYVEHAQPDCHSRELFKGIMDDAARATFNGHVLVSDGASKTEAFQTNKNILLTDKAHIDTKPFLEIYNDDVKCSHGSTIGQLDELALFYIRSRGISERTAKTMLLYAFCDEVIKGIELPELQSLLGDLVKKRLHGELTACSDCAIPCGTPCNGEEAAHTFKIDTTKL